MRQLTRLGVILAAALGFLCDAVDGQLSFASELCWKSAELAARPNDKNIRKNIAAAFIRPPIVQSIRLPPLLPSRRGAIRRVELPPGSSKLIAVTFDMCEQPYEISGYDGAIVDILRKEKVRATFFAGGKWLLSHETAAQQLMADPLFEIGNHTWEHRNLRLLSGTALRREIEAPQAAYEVLRAQLAKRACLARDGEKMAAENAANFMNLFRFPFGACNAASLRAVNDAGLLAIQWDVSSADPSIGIMPGQIARNVLTHVSPGSIVLFHGNGRGRHTAQALLEIIPKLREQGYKFVTINDLLRVPGAKWDIRPICFDERLGDTNRYDNLARRLENRFKQFYARFAGNSGDANVMLPGSKERSVEAVALPERNPAFHDTGPKKPQSVAH